MNLQAKFEWFAEKARLVVAHVYHFTGAIVVVLIWGLWAGSRGFDTFSQLVVNTPTTLAEYFYEVLILAAAIKAERTAEAVLTALISHQIEMKTMLEEELAETKEILRDMQKIERVLECVNCKEHFSDEELRYRDGMTLCPRCLKPLGAILVGQNKDGVWEPNPNYHKEPPPKAQEEAPAI